MGEGRGGAGSTASSPMQCSCASIHPACCQVYFLVPLCDLCRIHNVFMPPHLHTRPHHRTQCTAVPLKATQVSFLLHVFPSFCSPPLPLVLFCHPHGADQLPPLVRDVVASRFSAAFVAAFASALRFVTPDAEKRVNLHVFLFPSQL